LPVRYEITNTAGTSGASMMRQICATVISEGGYNAFTYSETAGRGTSVLRLSSSGTYYPVVSIRLDSTRLDAIVLPRQVDVLSPTVNYYRWKLVLNPTLTGANWAGHSNQELLNMIQPQLLYQVVQNYKPATSVVENYQNWVQMLLLSNWEEH
jgi:hypothetical protein